ncbi:hypothetical protein BDR26DRAFT_864381 [Obelidium mucronatum]|nr:hypothetical protein BDR26DRAFT_864381 [Obelidium mucronatum]
MGIPNDFYRELRDDEVVGNIKIKKEEGTVLETDQEMWLRLYGLDGGLTTRKRKAPPPPPPVLAPSVAASVSTPSASASLDSSSTVKRAHDSTHTNEHLTSAMKRRRFESDRIVLIGSVPHASLSVEEQKILNDVNAKIKSHSGNEAAIKSEDAIVSFGSESKSISTAGIVVAKEEGVVLIPSVQPRLDIVRASLETLKDALAVSVEGSGSHSNASLTEDKTETEKLKTEVLGLVELMKGQQQIIESLRRRIGALDE